MRYRVASWARPAPPQRGHPGGPYERCARTEQGVDGLVVGPAGRHRGEGRVRPVPAQDGVQRLGGVAGQAAGVQQPGVEDDTCGETARRRVPGGVPGAADAVEREDRGGTQRFLEEIARPGALVPPAHPQYQRGERTQGPLRLFAYAFREQPAGPQTHRLDPVRAPQHHQVPEGGGLRSCRERPLAHVSVPVAQGRLLPRAQPGGGPRAPAVPPVHPEPPDRLVQRRPAGRVGEGQRAIRCDAVQQMLDGLAARRLVPTPAHARRPLGAVPVEPL